MIVLVKRHNANLHKRSPDRHKAYNRQSPVGEPKIVKLQSK